MWEDFVKYNSIRTTFLKTFADKNFEVGDVLLPHFLYRYEKSRSILESWLYVKSLENPQPLSVQHLGTDITEEYLDSVLEGENEEHIPWNFNKRIITRLKELFPDMIRSGYDIKRLEQDVPNFSSRSIEEFYQITKGKYYTGYDLDEDLGSMIPFVKDQTLIETYKEEIEFYFKFRYDNYDMNLLCEYCSFPFGTHESRAERYRKTGDINFDYPREVEKYPVAEIFEKYCTPNNMEGTRLINIRGTNGSGKTTMVNNIYKDSVSKGRAEERRIILTDAKGKERNRYYDILWDKNIILLGGYNTPYGTKGTDRIGDVYEIVQGITRLMSEYKGFTIIVESATVSTSFWAYALLYKMLQGKGAEVGIVTLWMNDWDFIVNNIKNRTERKEGAKEPDYQGAINKREILYKNHFRFSSILGANNCMVMYPDSCQKDNMHLELSRVIEESSGRSLL